MKDAVRRIIFATVSCLISALPFLAAVDLFHWMVKMFRGLASFGALFALIPLAIVELAFIIMIGPFYKGARGPVRLIRRFLSVVGVELLLAFVLEAVRFVILRLSSGITLVIYADLRPALYTVTALVCLAVGVAFVGASVVIGRRLRMTGGR